MRSGEQAGHFAGTFSLSNKMAHPHPTRFLLHIFSAMELRVFQKSCFVEIPVALGGNIHH